MPTDGLAVLVVEGEHEPPWLAVRTARTIARLGVASTLVHVSELAAHLAERDAPTWILRAGAWPVGVPRMPRTSATGRSLLAFGATENDAGWSELLADTGGDLALARSAIPRVDSVVVEDPARFSRLLGDTLDQAFERAVRGRDFRSVRLASLDVGYEVRARVILAITTLHRGGAERVTLDLHRGLRERGYGAILAVLDRATRATYPVPRGAIDVHAMGEDRRARIEALAAYAVSADLVHAHLLDGEELAVLARSGVPLVNTLHNARSGWPPGIDDVLHKVTLTIGCSRAVSADVPNARTIWNGVATLPRPTREAARKLLGVPEPALVLVVVANERAQKRLERMPAILAELLRRGHDARLVIVGEGKRTDPPFAAVHEEAARVGVIPRIAFPGGRDDVETFYAAGDVALCTSAFEGLSLAHLEALDAGMPLVTVDVGGTDELAKKHDHVYVVADRPEAFADAIERSLEPPSSGLALDFRVERMVERHVTLFERTLGRDHTTRRRGLVLVTNNFATGGAQSSARRLLAGLHARGVPVTAVVIEEQREFPTRGRAALVAAGVPVMVTSRAGDEDAAVIAQEAARIIDERRPDAVLFWNVIPEHKILLADLLLDVPVWDVSPGEMYFASLDRYFARPRVALPYLTPKDYGKILAGAVVKYEAERARAVAVLGTTVHVIANGVDVGPPPPRDRPARIVGTLARISPDKKLEQLIDAVRELVDDVTVRDLGAGVKARDLEVHIAGEVELGFDEYAASLRERAEGLPIVWRGHQEASSFLAEIDLFAMISEPSGCPNSSLEAMAQGLAVVMTAVGGASEQVADDETGLLVPPANAVAFADAVAALLRDDERRRAMGAAGHRRARERFSTERMLDAYARLCSFTPE